MDSVSTWFHSREGKNKFEFLSDAACIALDSSTTVTSNTPTPTPADLSLLCTCLKHLTFPQGDAPITLKGLGSVFNTQNWKGLALTVCQRSQDHSSRYSLLPWIPIWRLFYEVNTVSSLTVSKTPLSVNMGETKGKTLNTSFWLEGFSLWVIFLCEWFFLGSGSVHKSRGFRVGGAP